MVAAAKKYATRPERITRFISELTKTPEEQDYAVRHLREAGPDAVPFLVEALSRPGLSTKDRQLMVQNIGRLDYSVVPALLAVVTSPDIAIATDAAMALGLIGDKQAIPSLTFLAAATTTPPTVRAAAREAIAHLSGRPFAAQPRTPVQVLSDAAWQYHRHQVEFNDEPIVTWAWDKDQKTLSSQAVSHSQAETLAGLELAQRALQLDPNDRSAQVVHLSLTLEKAIERIGFTAFPTQDRAAFAAAVNSGPSLLTQVLKTAVNDSKTDLAAAAAAALTQATKETPSSKVARLGPFVDALDAPGRRVQFAAARALVTLAPTHPFPGASRVVPTLARFVINQDLPRAIVIDGNPSRGSQLAGFLINLGYDPELEVTSGQGFLAAAESVNIELVLISYDLFQHGWGLNDTLANLGADGRTAAIPVFIYGPRNVRLNRPSLEQDYPGIRFLVQPTDVGTLQQQLRDLPTPFSKVERTRYAREATTLLAQIAKDSSSPLSSNLTAAVPALIVALSSAETAPAATVALGSIPDPDAQRSLASLTLDPSRETALRREVTTQLIHSIRRFGRLITADQEAKLLTAIRNEADPAVQADLLMVLRALRPVTPTAKPAVPHEPRTKE
jgi:HEAT repeat protein